MSLAANSTGLLSFLQGPAEEPAPGEEAPGNTVPATASADMEPADRARVVLELEKFLQRTLCFRAANRAGPSGVSAASKLARSSVRSRSSEEWTETERMGAFVLIAARMDAERVAKKAEREAAEAKHQLGTVMQQLSFAEKRLKQTQKALLKAEDAAQKSGGKEKEQSPFDDDDDEKEQEEKEDAKEDGALPSKKTPIRGPVPYVSVHWACNVVLSWLGNQNVALHVRLGVATIAAAAALWLCRGVFLLCRGITRWGASSSLRGLRGS